MQKNLLLAFSICLIFNFLFFVGVEGQEGSRDIMEEYCLKNWIDDPVVCADYVPEDYDERRAKYAALEAEKARERALEITNAKQESERVCPEGSHVTSDNQGNQICVDTTGRFVGYPNTGDVLGDNETLIGVGIVIILIIIVAIAAASRKGKGEQAITRNEFTEKTKNCVMDLQGGRCARCNKRPRAWDFHHKGLRDDNSANNCQGLCLDCHRFVTLTEKKDEHSREYD